MEYSAIDLFDIDHVPIDTPLYIILTGGSGAVKAKGVLEYSLEILSVIKEYLETGVIDIIKLFHSDQENVNIDELVDAFCYLITLYKPDNFPPEYWFATLTENWILEQWRKGNTSLDNKWLIDVTDLTYKRYAYPISIVNNPNYVVAGGYPLSLIDHNIEPQIRPHDVNVFYIGEDETLRACDELFINIHRCYAKEPVDTVKDIVETSYYNTFTTYRQFNDRSNICYESCNNGYLPTWKLAIKRYPSASHVLVSFNIDCEKVCCIGDRVYASPCGYYAIKNKVNKLTNNMTKYNELRKLFGYFRKMGYGLIGVDIDYNYDIIINTEYKSGQRFTFNELCGILTSSMTIGGLFDFGNVDNKYDLLESLHVGELQFSVIYPDDVRVHFHPTFESIDDVLQETSGLDDDIRLLANELICSYNWSFNRAKPNELVDFIWFDQYT